LGGHQYPVPPLSLSHQLEIVNSLQAQHVDFWYLTEPVEITIPYGERLIARSSWSAQCRIP
jgi:hypothetical protein